MVSKVRSGLKTLTGLTARWGGASTASKPSKIELRLAFSRGSGDSDRAGEIDRKPPGEIDRKPPGELGRRAGEARGECRGEDGALLLMAQPPTTGGADKPAPMLA